MSMEHKAFVFDYGRFQAELAPVLYAALESGIVDDLLSFIGGHRAELRTPDEGDPLPPNWEPTLRAEGVDRAGEVALTLYFNPLRDIGLDYGWQALGPLFPNPATVLGVPFGPAGHLFDPGKMGAWFQSPEMARKYLALVQEVACRRPEVDLSRCLAMFGKAVEEEKGLYVKF
jgi:hypothetical protein